MARRSRRIPTVVPTPCIKGRLQSCLIVRNPFGPVELSQSRSDFCQEQKPFNSIVNGGIGRHRLKRLDNAIAGERLLHGSIAILCAPQVRERVLRANLGEVMHGGKGLACGREGTAERVGMLRLRQASQKRLARLRSARQRGGSHECSPTLCHSERSRAVWRGAVEESLEACRYFVSGAGFSGPPIQKS